MDYTMYPGGFVCDCMMAKWGLPIAPVVDEKKEEPTDGVKAGY